MLTVLSVIGTRPEAIKMAPVVKELEKHSVRTRSILYFDCPTSGQVRSGVQRIPKSTCAEHAS